jgi:GTP-binding protein EngB required for normal cell division
MLQFFPSKVFETLFGVFIFMQSQALTKTEEKITLPTKLFKFFMSKKTSDEKKLIDESNVSSDQKSGGRIVLVGSTGVGKSSLGNFLLTSDTNKKIFPVGHSGESCTTQIAEVSLEYKGKKFTIMDAPGLNASQGSAEDLKNMMNLMDPISDKNKDPIIAVLFLVRYGKFDKQTQETMDYYSKLFSWCLNANAAVVLTHTPKPRMLREMKMTEESLMAQLQDALSKELQWPKLPVFAMNLPDEDDDILLKKRGDLLDRIAGLSKINASQILLEKTEAIKKLCADNAAFNAGILTGYVGRMIKKKHIPQDIGKNMLEFYRQRCKLDNEIAQLQNNFKKTEETDVKLAEKQQESLENEKASLAYKEACKGKCNEEKLKDLEKVAQECSLEIMKLQQPKMTVEEAQIFLKELEMPKMKQQPGMTMEEAQEWSKNLKMQEMTSEEQPKLKDVESTLSEEEEDESEEEMEEEQEEQEQTTGRSFSLR